MTDLKETLDFPAFPEGYGERITEEPIYLHNWLYSVVPVSERVEDWVNDVGLGLSQIHVSYPLFAYLAGYCRNCNNAFSRKIGSTRDYYSETPMNIPKEGCVAPR